MANEGKCFKCNRRKCCYRIYTKDLRFDEVACNEHEHDLELHADKVLGSHNGIMRSHDISSYPLRRATEKSLRVIRE